MYTWYLFVQLIRNRHVLLIDYVHCVGTGAAKTPVTAKAEAVLSVTTSAPVMTRDLHHGVTGLPQAGLWNSLTDSNF